MAGFFSAFSADHGGTSSAVPWLQKQVSMAPTSGRDAKVRLPFRRPPTAPASPVAKVLLTGFCLCCRWGVACQCLWWHWHDFWAEFWVLSVLQTDTASPSRSLLLPSLAPDIVSNVSGRISLVTGFAPGGRADVVLEHLGNRTQSGLWLFQLSFPGGKGDGVLASRD